MTSQDFVKFALQTSVMLAVALLFGQLMRRMKQPAVLGEIIGGHCSGATDDELAVVEPDRGSAE